MRTRCIWAAMVVAVGCLVLAAVGCGGGATTTAPTGYIQIRNGRVQVAQGTGVVIIRKELSQIPGVAFDRDGVQVKIYRGDLFLDPRTAPNPSSEPLYRIQVSRDGTLLEDLTLPEGTYTAVAENVRAIQEGKEFRCAVMAYVFQVFALGGRLRTTLPLKFNAVFPAIGAVIQDSYVEFITDVGIVVRDTQGNIRSTARLFMRHANGTVDMARPFVEQTEEGEPVAAVSFTALPGGPTLGDVQRLVLKALRP